VSLQHNAIALLEHAAQSLDGLAGAGIHPEECSYASVKLALAARTLQVEPLRAADVAEAFRQMKDARPRIQIVWDAKIPKPQQGFVTLACSAFNAVVELLKGLESFPEQVSLDHPQAATLQGRLRRLLPAGWWGNHD
jgi:hypothetical protein